MSFPFKAVVAVSALSSYLLVEHAPQYLLVGKRSYVGTTIQLVVLQFVVWAFYMVVLYSRYFSPLRHLPEPEGNSFFMGQWYRIKGEPSGVPQMDWVNSIPNNGLIRYRGMFNSERLVVTSAKALSEVLTTKNYDFAKPKHLTRGIGRILGIGILLAEGNEHKFQRKNLMPAFAFRHVKDLYPVFWDKSKEAVLAMTAQFQATAGKVTEAQKPREPSDIEEGPLVTADQAIFEVGGWASRATLDIIGVAGMGKDFGAIQNEDTPLYEVYRKIFRPNRQAQILGILALFLPQWFVRNLPVKHNGEVEAAVSVIRKTCHELIDQKKEKLAKKELKDVDILSVALESGGFTEENLVDQLMTFLAAGHETTASAMSWAIYMLCLHPEMQTRLRAEIRATLPSMDSDKSVSSQDIDSMPYLNAFCSEVLRYYAPVPMTLRETAVDTTIVGERIPKGTKVFLAIWANNKDRAMWGEDATEFNPDRWLKEANGGASSNYAYMTFLHGPRSCIGQAFAKAEFACLLATWAGRFDFELRDKEELDEKKMVIKGGITARPARGLWVKSRVVDGW